MEEKVSTYVYKSNTIFCCFRYNAIRNSRDLEKSKEIMLIHVFYEKLVIFYLIIAWIIAAIVVIWRGK